ncbi:hypothetical protein IBT49_25390 [Erwinia sp. S63]|uniref:hypothetical protein n=1 Tax=Erwiniaceae TaxID=1903409 RepID=UPI00190BC00A|nr:MULTISPECIES: hypothetical protein [Erwiniaceae]MBK0099339.1 hypothetical protein [Erwinia sp. S63]MBK0127329.1 hypothetical protein [Pantoea sp. S61]
MIDHLDFPWSVPERCNLNGDETDKEIREEKLRLLFRQINSESRLLPKLDAELQLLKHKNVDKRYPKRH